MSKYIIETDYQFPGAVAHEVREEKKTYVGDKGTSRKSHPIGHFCWYASRRFPNCAHQKTNKSTNRFIELIIYNVFTKRRRNELYKNK